MIGWYIYVIVVFAQSWPCMNSDTRMLWIAMLILFIDACWMLIKCNLITCCLCFFICLAVGCFFCVKNEE